MGRHIPVFVFNRAHNALLDVWYHSPAWWCQLPRTSWTEMKVTFAAQAPDCIHDVKSLSRLKFCRSRTLVIIIYVHKHEVKNRAVNARAVDSRLPQCATDRPLERWTAWSVLLLECLHSFTTQAEPWRAVGTVAPFSLRKQVSVQLFVVSGPKTFRVLFF